MRALSEVRQIVMACRGSTLGKTSSRFLFYLLAASLAAREEGIKMKHLKH